MRKWLLIGTLSVALASAGFYWYCTTNTIATNSNQHLDNVNRAVLNDKKDGDAEASEETEPLIVDHGTTGVQSPETPRDEGPMPRVVLAPGMKQPPRPDAAPGRVPRMPYADEEEILALTLDPIKQILESTLPRLDIFEEIEKADRAEESENKGANPPAARPEADPPSNYHHQQCPNYGRCPAPYYPRPVPRE